MSANSTTTAEILLQETIGHIMLYLRAHPEEHERWLAFVQRTAGTERHDQWQAWLLSRSTPERGWGA